MQTRFAAALEQGNPTLSYCFNQNKQGLECAVQKGLFGAVIFVKEMFF
jgi:hypothetical protein